MSGGIERVYQSTESGLIVSRFQSRKGALPADVGDWREALGREQFLGDVRALLERGRQEPGLKAAVPGAAWITNTGSAAIALSAATGKTLWYVNAAANDDVSLCEMCVGFDGITAAVPALVELVYGTKATNSTPNSGSTSFTPLQTRGWAVKAASSASANNCTSEPTALTSHRQWLLSPNGGLLVVQFPLGREPTAHNIASTSGLQIGCRVTAPAAVNARSYVEFEES